METASLSPWKYKYFDRPAYTRGQQLPELLQQRVLIMDGAMGTMIQRLQLDEAGFRGAATGTSRMSEAVDFRNWPCDVKNNSDLLVLTQAPLIKAIHEKYLRSGADLISTNTFGANALAQADYGMQGLVREMNLAAAKIAVESAREAATAAKPRFVAGAMGPTPKTASISPEVGNPAARNTKFSELYEAYLEQARALFEGGVDCFLVETIFDTLNARAALFAIDALQCETGERLPLIVSGTVTDSSGRILSGQTVPAFWASIRHARPLAVGLNCALGAAALRPYIQELAALADDCFISCYPNAGLPNPMSDTGFDETPEVTSSLLHGFVRDGLVNLVGGCCGTTPEHILAIGNAVAPLCQSGQFRRVKPTNRTVL